MLVYQERDHHPNALDDFLATQGDSEYDELEKGYSSEE